MDATIVSTYAGSSTTLRVPATTPRPRREPDRRRDDSSAPADINRTGFHENMLQGAIAQRDAAVERSVACRITISTRTQHLSVGIEASEASGPASPDIPRELCVFGRCVGDTVLAPWQSIWKEVTQGDNRDILAGGERIGRGAGPRPAASITPIRIGSAGAPSENEARCRYGSCGDS